MKILVADDSKVMRMLVRRALRQAGYGNAEVTEACDGEEAYKTFVADGQFDLVMSDWNMPNLNGFGLLKNIRADGFRVPFVFVTTECTSEMREQAHDAGADKFIVKPFDGDDVKYALEPLVGVAA
jgi:two-component system chemotaxis response regulator CheY